MVLRRKNSEEPRLSGGAAAARRAAVLAAAAIWLSGCGGQAKQTFDLNALPAGAPLSAKAPARRHVQLSVSAPGALKPLDSQNIVIRGADSSVSYLSGAQWSDRLTDMVQARLIQALEDSRHFGGVGRPRDGLNANYQLITDLRVFGVDLDAQGRIADVQISARIMDDKSGAIRKTRVFSATRRLSGTSNADYAAALDGAFSAVLQNIVTWAAQSL